MRLLFVAIAAVLGLVVMVLWDIRCLSSWSSIRSVEDGC